MSPHVTGQAAVASKKNTLVYWFLFLVSSILSLLPHGSQ